MGALQQYLDLYDSQRQAVEANSAEPLNALRSKAREALEGKQLPHRGTEGFEKTSIDEMFTPDYGINLTRLALPCDIASAFKCGVPNVSTLLAVVVNDRFVPTSTLLKNLPEGVTVMSLAQAAQQYPETISRHYGSAADLGSAGSALNTLLAQDGVYIHVDRGVRLERPIQIVTLSSSPVPMLTMRRMLVVAEQGASFSILTCDHSMNAGIKALTSQVTEIIAGADSHIDICDIEETDASYSRYSQVYVTQHDRSNVAIGGMTLHNGVTRNEYRVNIIGDESQFHLDGMAVDSGSQ
ncbi:MAG: SufD family Fe-S cluster assembly protein, partial [Muribaculaceae bacterium]|nr:SufD family Fe-S cluster assembly protein [Muribaculaceae bacterium]